MSPELLVTAAAGLLFGMVLFKLSALEGRLDRLARLEGKVDALLVNLGVTYDPRAGVPDEVVALALDGRTIDAVKRRAGR